MDLEGMCKPTESKMEGQVIVPLEALITKRASRCLLLTWRGRKLNLTKMSSHLDVLSLLIIIIITNSVAQEPEGSSPHSQQPATGPCPETVEFNNNNNNNNNNSSPLNSTF
jgi:hypothetical protein